VSYGQNIQNAGVSGFEFQGFRVSRPKTSTTEALSHGETFFLFSPFVVRLRVSAFIWRHPERSRFSGVVKDLAWSGCAFSPREILPRTGESARVQDDAFKSCQSQYSVLGARDSGLIFSPMLTLARLLASRFGAQRVFKELAPSPES
jgi:hypothetical protein